MSGVRLEVCITTDETVLEAAYDAARAAFISLNAGAFRDEERKAPLGWAGSTERIRWLSVSSLLAMNVRSIFEGRYYCLWSTKKNTG